MFPNPQDALPLPPPPYANRAAVDAQASALLDARAPSPVVATDDGMQARHAWAARWIATTRAAGPREAPQRRDADRLADAIARYAGHRLTSEGATREVARDILARIHGFADWNALAAHLDARPGDASPANANARFERAADAIVGGDVETLDALLRDDPALVHARSARVHRATLLHYVAANGVENWRQRTPANIVDIARRLLDAGSDVNAEADAYGGGAKTLGLVVTSAHPRAAGVQRALAALLLDRGAPMEPRIVHAALMNGCPEAAAHMVERGAELDLPEAAALGRLDLVPNWFEPERRASAHDAALALIGATWYGQRAIVAYLVGSGVPVDARHPNDGETPLHIAAYACQRDVLDELLSRGAPVDATDHTWRTTPLVWALHGWLVEGKGTAESYRYVIRQLVEHGATVKPEWIDDPRVREDAALWPLLARRAGRGTNEGEHLHA